MLNCTGSPLQSLPPAQLPYSLVNFCVVLSARCWEEGWLKQQNSLVSFVPVCVEIVILFGVWWQVGSGRGSRGLRIASLWMISKCKHSFVCKCCLNLSDGSKDMLSSHCLHLQCEMMTLFRKSVYLSFYVVKGTVFFAQAFHLFLDLWMPAQQISQSLIWGLLGLWHEKLSLLKF